jgi:3-oxoacyl-[acyl-carrier protein] reductase
LKKTAIITGGSRGIGFAIAKKLAEDGFNIVITARSPKENSGENFAVLDAMGVGYLFLQSDISKAEDRTYVVQETVKRFGAIHVLVNNAGVAPEARCDLLEMTEESFDRVVGINTKGTMFMSQAVANQMLAQQMEGRKRGTIINISSCSAVVSSVNRGEYCVSKAGIAMLTTLFADRLASEGILVHEVRPGVIETDMTSGVKEKYDRLFASGAFPLARWGQPEDIANAVGVLADDSFLYTTGNHIDVDGGFHIQRL